MKLEFDIASGDFSKAGRASSRIKKMLKQLQVDPKVIKRIVVAIYEAEVNVVAHSVGGKMLAEIDGTGITVIVQDNGPGIEDIEKAMQEGYSTATKAVRNMGFGAGMGLPNINRNTDEFTIESELGVGTVLTFRNNF
ncbi:Anti-sigma regulatory factor (Ser/Thr protein kinase) [Draconibacterium orientale]|uniref:Anti-sigma regulatory factor n=1 Tax=Draconibacterium orientale TaxID=1168034 RepID=X5DUS5_9BACT|nr:ATP-binding protein [Draconibacterium orientale]AHW58925.1 anti-sigma regulatory factor [Draconibacterium orientale]SEU14138.1 Anti-sigma regulatory factor (Ser/Thr protein kinase) [Draconibacterium orientale]